MILGTATVCIMTLVAFIPKVEITALSSRVQLSQLFITLNLHLFI